MDNCSTKYAQHNPSHLLGLDVSCTDGETVPLATEELSSAETEKWFTSYPSSLEAPAIRLLVLKDRKPAPGSPWLARPHFTEDVIRHAIWRPDAYLDLPKHGGGCAAFLDEPYCFVLKTPCDDGPACSLAISRRGHIVKGIYAYQDHRLPSPNHPATFDPETILPGENIQSGWRSTGVQIVILPQAIAKAHARYIASELQTLVRSLETVEREISQYTPSHTPSFSAWSLTLHASGTALLNLERRARFQAQVFAAIESVTTTHHHYKGKPWPPLAPLKSQLEAWTFDFETLPRRIENARSAINGFMQQRNEMLNLSIAHSSRQMTEAALRDNVTMKTIAILTMLFLPATAVATFFSMTMFNWEAESGSGVGSKWLWVFFAVAVPLTGVVLGVWYGWVRRYEREVEARYSDQESGLLGLLRDEVEVLETQAIAREVVEVEEMRVDGKAGE